jgi:hypothetical protein
MIPAQLRNLDQWVLWRYEQRGGSLTKVPYGINGRMASSMNHQTWSAYEDAASSEFECDGLGFVFSAGDPFVGIDLDGCIDPTTKKVVPWARAIIKRFNTYCEYSPSGTGVKLFVVGELKDGKGRKKDLSEAKVNEKNPGIEVYDRGRYFAMTGEQLPTMPDEPQELQAELDAFMAELFPPAPPPVMLTAKDRARRYMQKMPPAISGQSGHNATFRVACVLVLGFGLDRTDAFDLLTEYNDGCQPPWSQQELLHKVDSAMKQPGERNYLRDVPFADWDSVEIPTYTMTKEQPTKKEVKTGTLVNHARSYLNKLRNGEDTLISLGLPEVDKMLDGGVAPGEMVLIGARPSHGKTAASMQSLHHWTAQGISSLLVSEEMGPLLLGKRTMQYVADIPKEQWESEVEQLDLLLSGYEKLRADCHVVESCGDVKTVVQQIEHHVKEHGVQCVVVDYAQKLEGTGKGRYEQATNVSIQLSSVAKRLNIVLLVLVQLSRKIEERKPFVPMPSDIKESGQFEQDADVVLFQVWPWKIDSNKPKEEYQFFCCKNRNREIQCNGFVKCRFLGNRQKFVSDKQFVATAMQHDFTPDEKVDEDFHNFS